MAVYKIVAEIIIKIDEGEIVADVSKTFDTIDHKLERGVQLLKPYIRLNRCQQKVPLLFLMYVNDLPGARSRVWCE